MTIYKQYENDSLHTLATRTQETDFEYLEIEQFEYNGFIMSISKTSDLRDIAEIYYLKWKLREAMNNFMEMWE